MHENPYDVVVVGGGLGGLMAAQRLMALGRAVVVLEQAAAPGGQGRSPALADVPVNLGPHALYRKGRAVAVLGELGVELRGFDPAAAGGGFFEREHSLLPMPASPLGLLTLSWLSWRERVELAWAMREVASAKAPGTLAEWLARRRSPLVQQVLAALCRVTSYTNDPEATPAARALRQLRAGLKGVVYLDDGWQAVVAALARGVTLRTGVGVTRVQRDERGALVHCKNGEVLRARDVVLALPLSAAARVTADAALAERAARSSPVRAACVDLVLRELPAPQRRLVLGLDSPTYFSVHTRPAASPVKVHVAYYLAPSDDPSPEVMEERLNDFLERVQPGWRDVIAARRYFPAMRVMDDLPGRGAATLEPPLHLVSGLASDGYLLDGVAESADAAAAALTRARAVAP